MWKICSIIWLGIDESFADDYMNFSVDTHGSADYAAAEWSDVLGGHYGWLILLKLILNI